MKPQQKSPETFEEIVFRDRNKLYGAYFLRKIYPRTVVIAVIITLLGFSVIVTYSKLALKPAGYREVVITYHVPPAVVDPGSPPVAPPPAAQGAPAIRPLLPPRVVDTVTDNTLPLAGEVTGTVDSAGPGPQGPLTVPAAPESPPVIASTDPEAPTILVEVWPAFPGGEEEMMRFLSKNVQYPELARESGITGTVILEFVVEKDGAITGIKVVRSIGGGCDEAAVRAVKMMPNWTPGTQQGNPVRVQFHLPVRFTLR
jgi:periplasmic protein TonB